MVLHNPVYPCGYGSPVLVMRSSGLPLYGAALLGFLVLGMGLTARDGAAEGCDGWGRVSVPQGGVAACRAGL